jgi:hypothetical protein
MLLSGNASMVKGDNGKYKTRCSGEINFDKRQARQWQIADFGE